MPFQKWLRKTGHIGVLALSLAVSFFSFRTFAEKLPTELQGIGVDEHLGSQINLNLKFQDETGSTVPLKTYFNGIKPVLFFLVYFECPNLCTFVLNGTVDSIKKMNWNSGQDFEVVAVSIDPKETPNLAAEKKRAYLAEYGRPAAAAKGWHFLVGKQAEITELAQEIGFKYKWDPDQNQFAHASTMFVLTGEGKISRYFYGIQYPVRDLKVAMMEAGQGHIGNLVDKILLFCYHYDSAAKKYVLMASRLMSAAGALTVLILGSFLLMSWRREKIANA